MAGNKWNELSFLLELKPLADFANLFISCPEGGSREVVKVLQSALEIGPGPADKNVVAEELPKLISGEIKGIQMHPESLSSIAWADNETLFTCRLKADTAEKNLDIKGPSDLAIEVNGEKNVDEFCKLLRATSPAISCSYCEESLLAEGARITKTHALPCDDWQDSVPTLEFFCADAENSCCKGPKSDSRPGTVAQQEESNLLGSQCLVAESYFLVAASVLGKKITVSKRSTVQCAHCLSEIGIAQKDVSSDSGPSEKEVLKLFHSTVDLKPKAQNGAESCATFLTQRFGSLEQYMAWWLLTQSQKQSSLKFVIRSLDKTPKLLIWLLDSYSIMIRGYLSNSQQQTEELPWEPFPAIKVLYKVLDDTNSAIPRVAGEDFSVGDLEQTSGACLSFTQRLLDSSQSLPPACRSVGHFYVGYLKLGQTWNFRKNV